MTICGAVRQHGGAATQARHCCVCVCVSLTCVGQRLAEALGYARTVEEVAAQVEQGAREGRW